MDGGRGGSYHRMSNDSGSSASHHSTERRIIFVGVGRVSDGVLVASHAHKSHVLSRSDVARFMSALCARVIRNPRLLEPGRQYTQVDPANVGGGTGSELFCYVTDEKERIFLVVVEPGYPERVAFKMVDELILQFTHRYDAKSLKCKEEGLTKSCRDLFGTLASSYDDPGAHDSLTRIQGQVDSAKGAMADNINTMLANTERLEDVADKAEGLKESTIVFKKQAGDLKRAMWWKDAKWKFIIAVVILLILGACVGVAYVFIKKS